MTQEDFNWVQQNYNLVAKPSRLNKEESLKLFTIFNSLTGENRRVTSCGRCVELVKKTILHEYNKKINEL